MLLLLLLLSDVDSAFAAAVAVAAAVAASVAAAADVAVDASVAVECHCLCCYRWLLLSTWIRGAVKLAAMARNCFGRLGRPIHFPLPPPAPRAILTVGPDFLLGCGRRGR